MTSSTCWPKRYPTVWPKPLRKNAPRSAYDLLGICKKDEQLSVEDLLVEKFTGIRPAVGYPSLPDQSVNFVLSEWLGFPEIGIRLTENGAMVPHASVSGLMLSHPSARYFAVGKIGEDQLEDYARRRGLPVETMRKFLAANL